MMTIEHQDSDIILVHPYTYTGETDMYVKRLHPDWSQSVIGSDYKVLIDRRSGHIIQASNEFWDSKYQAIEPSLVGDVLILGAGLQTLATYLTTGTSWKWVEINPYLASIVPAVGTMHEGDANDIDFILSLGTFDTILVDFNMENYIKDYSAALNLGGTIIYFQI